MSAGDRRGFSALEVLGSVLLIGFAVVPVMNLFPSGARQTGLTQAHVQAQALIDGAVDEWIAGAIVSRPPGESLRSWRVPALQGAEPFEVTLSASEVEGKRGLWSVSVKVEWTFPAGKSHSLETERLFCEPDLSLRSEVPSAPPSRWPGRETS